MELTSDLIYEGNLIIAKFMGWKQDAPHSRFYNPNGDFHFEYELYFHSSLDWLMPVIEKFESIGGFVRIEKTEIIVHHSGIKDINLGCISYMLNNGKVLTSQEKLEGVWLGIVNFLKEYNQKLNISL